VRIDVSLPALAHRVTVFGSTRNIVATSAGVSSGSASGVRAVMSGFLHLHDELPGSRVGSAGSSPMVRHAFAWYKVGRAGNRTNVLSFKN
jgi:hypothetical protein